MLVRYNKKNIYQIEGFRFMPGINNIDGKLFDKMKKYDTFKFRIDRKIIEVVESEKSPSTVKDGVSAYADKTVKEMEAFIGEIYKKELLEQIIAEDKRPAVKKAVNEQLEKITVTDEKKKKSQANTAEDLTDEEIAKQKELLKS